ncbi:uncharacterized protein [Ptychodera flava]|uniref:uncharacterized protein isoform X2 n=1 Tax=Ptychodera flava TaxID=63121 RepID=UPI003969E7FC
MSFQAGQAMRLYERADLWKSVADFDEEMKQRSDRLARQLEDVIRADSRMMISRQVDRRKANLSPSSLAYEKQRKRRLEQIAEKLEESDARRNRKSDKLKTVETAQQRKRRLEQIAGNLDNLLIAQRDSANNSDEDVYVSLSKDSEENKTENVDIESVRERRIDNIAKELDKIFVRGATQLDMKSQQASAQRKPSVRSQERTISKTSRLSQYSQGTRATKFSQELEAINENSDNFQARTSSKRQVSPESAQYDKQRKRHIDNVTKQLGLDPGTEDRVSRVQDLLSGEEQMEQEKVKGISPMSMEYETLRRKRIEELEQKFSGDDGYRALVKKELPKKTERKPKPKANSKEKKVHSHSHSRQGQHHYHHASHSKQNVSKGKKPPKKTKSTIPKVKSPRMSDGEWFKKYEFFESSDTEDDKSFDIDDEPENGENSAHDALDDVEKADEETENFLAEVEEFFPKNDTSKPQTRVPVGDTPLVLGKNKGVSVSRALSMNTQDAAVQTMPEVYYCWAKTESGEITGPFKLELGDLQTSAREFVVNFVGTEKVLENVKVANKPSAGISHRQTGSNNINEYSSRSHSMLSLFIDSEVPDPDDDTLYITKQGKLSFVDLAGSEKIKELGNTGGELLTETTNINKSLLTLGNCISSLSDPKKKSGYIPYRDSKLTKLLADSLGGNGVTLMIACVSPSSYSLPESMNTLRYANRAKRIKNKPVVRMDPREKLLMSLKREVKLLRSENEYLKGHVHLQKPEKSKESDKGETTPHATTNGHIPNSHNSESDTPIQKPKPKVEKKKRENSTSSISTSLSMKSAADNGLYEMLQEYMIENENLRSENNELVSTRERARREHEFLSKENEKLGKKLEDLERVMATSPLSFARYSFYSRGSSGRSSQPIALASVSSWRAESNTPVSQPPQPDQQVQPLPQQGFTQQQQQQQHPPQPQPQQSLPQQQQQQQYPPNSYPAPGGHPQQPFYQPYSQQQPPPPPPPAQQQQQPQQQPYGQQRISPNNPINRNGPNRQPPPKKQLHELPPVDNMKGVPNTYKSNKQSPFQLQQKNSKNKLFSQRNQDPNGSYVDRFQQQQTFNKLYGPEQGTTPRQSKQANISIPPARGLERRDESSSPPDKGPSHSKPAPTHQQSSPKQQHPAANARASDKPHVKGHAERKAKGARGEKGDPSLDAIPPTPTATPPPVKYTPKGTSQMLQSSSLDTAKSSASTGNWSQINDKLRQELQELDGEIEYMKYMNKSQATSAATAPKPAPRTRKR